jgi:hypothetical protein
MITTYASGSQACTVTTEHDLSAPNVQGSYRLVLDLNALVAGDVLEVRAYRMTVAGGTSRAHLFTAYYGAQAAHALIVEPFEELTNALTDTNAIRYTIKQTFGTSRTIPWRVDKDDALTPTTTARTLDVTATGAAGIDWANVENPTTALNLSATNIDVDQVVASVSGAVGSVTGAVGSVGAGGITASSIATGAIDADALATDAVTEIQSGLSTLDAAGIRAAVGLALADLDTQLDALVTILADTNELQTDWANGGRLDLLVDAIKAKTDQLTFTIANQVDSNALSGGGGGGGLDAAGVRAAIGLASANLDTQLGAIDDLLDTEVAAIKAKTDSLTFTVAGQVDANIQYVNDTVVTGTGTDSDPWGP